MFLTNIKRLLTGSEKNPNVCIIKQDKGPWCCSCGFQYRLKCTEKFVHILQTEQFTKLIYNLTKFAENKIQGELRN